MTFRKHVMISIVLLCVSGLLLGCSDDGTVAPAQTTDEAPPAIITGLEASMTPAGIELTWLASSHPTLRGYNVYRHMTSESAIGLLNSTPLSANRFLDATAESGPVYEYLVTAVTVKGTESAYAAITIVTEPGKTKAKIREKF